jgi:uncharacterized protein YciI
MHTRPAASRLALTIAAILIAAHASAAQRKEEPKVEMQNYFLFLLELNSSKSGDPPSSMDALRAGHLEHMREMAKSGRLVAAGPTLDDGALVGVGIMLADSLESARAEVESDPTVKAGILKADVRPWFGAKGIGAHLAADAAASPLQDLEMETLYFGLIVKGDAWTPERTPETEKIQEGHMANIRRLAAEGTLCGAGPFEDNGDYRGIFVYRVATQKDAEALAATDPAVKAGRLKVLVHPWRVPKGVFPSYAAK